MPSNRKNTKLILSIFLIYITIWLIHGLFLKIITGRFFQFNPIIGMSIEDSKNKSIFINHLKYSSLTGSNYEKSINSNIEMWAEKPKYYLKYYYLGFNKFGYDANTLRICLLNRNDSFSVGFVLNEIDSFNYTGIQMIDHSLPTSYSVDNQKSNFKTKIYFYKDFEFVDSGNIYFTY